MRRLHLLLVLAVLLFPAISAIADEKPLPKPEALSEEEIMTSKRLSTYDTIIINDFKTEGAEYTNVNEEEKPKVDKLKPLLVKILAESLENELKNRKLFKSILRNAEAKGNAVVLEGSFTEFNAGNRGARFWAGIFGAGKTYLKIKGRLVDATSGKVLAVFEDRETGYKGTMTLEDFEGLFPHQAKSIGENLAIFIEKLY
jgi:curli biogenesis system outer membrane secretion channel CsgG